MCGSSLEFRATCARDCYSVIGWMFVGFHEVDYISYSVFNLVCDLDRGRISAMKTPVNIIAVASIWRDVGISPTRSIAAGIATGPVR